MKTLALVATLLAAGCASMVNGRFQNVPVTSAPAHAAIALKCPGEEERHAGYTPATVTLRRGAEGCRITLTKLGYYDETIRFQRVPSPVAQLDALPGALLGSAAALVAALPTELVAGEDAGNAAGAAAFNKGASAPFAIDEHSGAAFDQVPREVHVDLVRRP